MAILSWNPTEAEPLPTKVGERFVHALAVPGEDVYPCPARYKMAGFNIVVVESRACVVTAANHIR